MNAILFFLETYMPTTAMRPASKRAPAKVATGRADATPAAPAAPTTPASLLRHGHGVQQVANASHHSRADIKTLPSSDSGIVDSRLLSLSLSVCVSIKKDLILESRTRDGLGCSVGTWRTGRGR